MENLKDKTFLYPTDTVWGIGCDASQEELVSKIYAIKNRAASKSLVLLVNSLEMLQRYIPVIPKKAMELIEEIDTPLTIIYENPIGIARNAIAEDNTVAIRIVNHEVCCQLIAQIGGAIVSTSANISGNTTPKQFSEIEKPILESVDYLVNLQTERISAKSSKIVKITEDNQVHIIRE